VEYARLVSQVRLGRLGPIVIPREVQDERRVQLDLARAIWAVHPVRPKGAVPARTNQTLSLLKSLSSTSDSRATCGGPPGFARTPQPDDGSDSSPDAALGLIVASCLRVLMEPRRGEPDTHL